MTTTRTYRYGGKSLKVTWTRYERYTVVRYEWLS